MTHREVVRGELGDSARLFGHFTLVAATGVLATRLGGGPARVVGHVLLVVVAVVWAVLAGALVRLRRAALRAALRHCDGTWFLAAVGLQALVLTLTHVRPGPTVTTVALALWATAVLLYAATLAAVVRRLLRHPPRPAQLAPSYWVAMGAAAISTLAGAQLLTSGSPLWPPARPALAAAVVALWSWASLLIPVLLAAGLWRHLHHRVPFAYEPALWCIVFPLGMYATATAQLATAQGVTTASLPQHALVWLASASWLAVAARCLAARIGTLRTATWPWGDAL